MKKIFILAAASLLALSSTSHARQAGGFTNDLPEQDPPGWNDGRGNELPPQAPPGGENNGPFTHDLPRQDPPGWGGGEGSSVSTPMFSDEGPGCWEFSGRKTLFRRCDHR